MHAPLGPLVVLGCLILCALTTRSDAAAPIAVSRSVHFDVASPAQQAQVTDISYASIAHNALIKCIGTPQGCLIRRSEDNGKTWTTTETWQGSAPIEGDRYLERDTPVFFLDPNTGWMLRVFMECESLRGVPPWDDKSPVIATRRLYTQVSKDEGKTWGARQQLIQAGAGYDAVHWAAGVWYGKNSLAVEGTHILKLGDGTILMPYWGYRLHENDSIRSPQDGWTTSVNGCFLGKWRADGSGVDWDGGTPMTLPRKYSVDGADEPSIVVLPDGRLFMVIRARVMSDSKTALPGLKHFSLSGDSGRTWSEGEPLLYDDGSYPYSPACLGNVLRSEKNGRYYLITNLNSAPGSNCDPRNTLQIAELDVARMCIRKSTVTPIETRTGEQPPNIRFSNFRWVEDRETQDIVLYLTACPGDVGRSPTCGCPPQSFRYDIRLPAVDG